MMATSLTPRTVRSKWKPFAFGEASGPAALGLVGQRVEPLARYRPPPHWRLADRR
jgi:hypothetical protein